MKHAPARRMRGQGPFAPQSLARTRAARQNASSVKTPAQSISHRSRPERVAEGTAGPRGLNTRSAACARSPWHVSLPGRSRECSSRLASASASGASPAVQRPAEMPRLGPLLAGRDMALVKPRSTQLGSQSLSFLTGTGRADCARTFLNGGRTGAACGAGMLRSNGGRWDFARGRETPGRHCETTRIMFAFAQSSKIHHRRRLRVARRAGVRQLGSRGLVPSDGAGIAGARAGRRRSTSPGG